VRPRLPIVVALSLLAVASAPAAGGVRNAWVQLLDDGVAEARAVVDSPFCPTVEIDGRPHPMAVRAASEAAAFPNLVCAAALPSDAQAVSVGGHVLPAPPRRAVQRIVVIGDTGCRIKGANVQDCNDPRRWPFALLVRRAAAERPDLVIHVGDYYYRETACPASYAGCADSPHGDQWPSWQADFFDPAQPLLDAAPWVFARGNHESCDRGGKGWNRLLDAGSAASSCRRGDPVFSVPIGGGVTLYVFDSADADDRLPRPDAVRFVADQIDTLPHAVSGGQDWIVTHRPFWGEAPAFGLGPFGVFSVGVNRTEQAAARGKDLSAIALILSGHIHHFASFDFGDARPAQLVVGAGGDIGEPFDPAKVAASDAAIDGMQAKGLTFQRYGYFMMERQAQGWSGVFKDMDGRIVARCTLEGRRLACANASA
jgi:hypothetical protein